MFNSPILLDYSRLGSASHTLGLQVRVFLQAGYPCCDQTNSVKSLKNTPPVTER